MARPRLLFLVTEDWFFVSFRLDLARAARDAGYDVIVASRVGEMAERIKAERFRLEPLNWQRRSLNPAALIRDIVVIARLYRRLRPDIVHHVSLKPILLGGVAALATPAARVVNTLSGLGYMFTARGARARTLARIAPFILGPLLRRRGTMTVVENDDDRRFLIERLRVPASQTANFGAGVDLDCYGPMSRPDGEPVALAYVGRLLAIKGVAELVAASRILRKRGVAHRLVLAGLPDPGSPDAIAQSTLEQWVREDGVEWHGHVADVREVWRRAAIAVQPSLGGEGLPRSLLEAAACGRPLIATDTPGCRNAVRPGVNGLLVPPSDPTALADAMEQLIGDAALRAQYAAGSRRLAEAEFSLEGVLAQTVALYDRLACRRH